jgi:UDP-N-acetylmuramoyl-tripeptide--D-alanyl-D-alanine ligase
VTLVDDSYNASPGSVIAALELLSGLPGRRLAVLGEMLELGDDHDDGHRRVGAAASDVVDRLIVVGEGARGIVEGTTAPVELVADRDAARDRLLEVLEPGDVVLLKASRGIGLDILVDELAASLGAPASAAQAPPE